MNILFARFPLESTHGGAEVQTLSLMKGLRERGHDVAFLGSCPVLLEETAKLRLPHAKLLIGPPPVTKLGAVSFLWRRRRMRQQLEAALAGFPGLDAIFMLSLSEKLLLTDIAVQKGIKVFWVEHDRMGRWLTKNPWLPMLRKLSMAVTTVCVSELSRKKYLDAGWSPKKTIAIPNGIDLQKFDGVREAGSGLRLGCVARLSPEKGVDILIRAVADLVNISLIIVGTGPQEALLQNLITSLQRTGKLTIIPRVDDLGAFYRSIDVLVLPSCENDPFGLVVAEAMSCGTPVVVTDQCGIAGYLRDGTDAIIAKASSQESLRKAILRMQDTAVRREIGGAAKETVREKFGLEKMVDAYAAALGAG